jgi:hypothetical protein
MPYAAESDANEPRKSNVSSSRGKQDTRITKSTFLATPTMCECAIGRVPSGLMPVTSSYFPERALGVQTTGTATGIKWAATRYRSALCGAPYASLKLSTMGTCVTIAQVLI